MPFLVVEDHEIMAQVMGRLLAPFGEMHLAASALDAQKLLASRDDWTAFFIDLRLPDGSGIDLLSHARVDYPHTPAMILTAAVDAAAINAAFDLDADYVLKPLQPARIEKFLRSRRDFGARVEDAVTIWRQRYSLSEAEADVLRRASLGESRAEIAEARGCSLLTIKTQVTNLIQKTGDPSLHGAVSRLLRGVAGDVRASWPSPR
ncbi:MAG TPA: response regulator [Polyangiaceae bacterium]